MGAGRHCQNRDIPHGALQAAQSAWPDTTCPFQHPCLYSVGGPTRYLVAGSHTRDNVLAGLLSLESPGISGRGRSATGLVGPISFQVPTRIFFSWLLSFCSDAAAGSGQQNAKTKDKKSRPPCINNFPIATGNAGCVYMALNCI